MFKHFFTAHSRHLLILLLTATLLSACGEGDKPSKSWEVAAKGSHSAALSADGKLAIIGSIHHGGSLWAVEKNERLFNWNHKEGEPTTIVAAAFSPDNRWAVTASPYDLVLWDVKTGEALRYWTAPGEILAVDLTPNGNYALLGLSDHTAVLFDIKKGGIRRTFVHDNRVRSVALSKDGKVAITGSEDETARTWDITTGKPLAPFQHGDAVQVVTLSPNGKVAFSVSKYDRAAFWNPKTGKHMGDIPLQSFAVQRGLTFTSARFSSSGGYLLTGTADRLVQLWSVKKRKEINSWAVPKRDAWKPTSASIEALSFSKKKGTFYTVASNGFIHRLRLKKKS